MDVSQGRVVLYCIDPDLEPYVSLILSVKDSLTGKCLLRVFNRGQNEQGLMDTNKHAFYSPEPKANHWSWPKVEK